MTPNRLAKSSVTLWYLQNITKEIFAKFLFWMCDECGRDFAPEKDQEAVDPSDLGVEWKSQKGQQWLLIVSEQKQPHQTHWGIPCISLFSRCKGLFCTSATCAIALMNLSTDAYALVDAQMDVQSAWKKDNKVWCQVLYREAGVASM